MPPSPHPATLPDSDLLDQCEVVRTRRSGPGGQHRNKVETAIVLTHLPTGVRAEANERRSQSENQAVAIFRLRVSLAVAVRQLWTDDRSPSPLWQSRCSGGRIFIRETHADFPALLAEALDCLLGHNWDVAATAGSLGCSGTQLLQLLQKERSAFTLLNDERARLGLHKLRARH